MCSAESTLVVPEDVEETQSFIGDVTSHGGHEQSLRVGEQSQVLAGREDVVRLHHDAQGDYDDKAGQHTSPRPRLANNSGLLIPSHHDAVVVLVFHVVTLALYSCG